MHSLFDRLVIASANRFTRMRFILDIAKFTAIIATDFILTTATPMPVYCEQWPWNLKRKEDL